MHAHVWVHRESVRMLMHALRARVCGRPKQKPPDFTRAEDSANQIFPDSGVDTNQVPLILPLFPWPETAPFLT